MGGIKGLFDVVIGGTPEARLIKMIFDALKGEKPIECQH